MFSAGSGALSLPRAISVFLTLGGGTGRWDDPGNLSSATLKLGKFLHVFLHDCSFIGSLLFFGALLPFLYTHSTWLFLRRKSPLSNAGILVPAGLSGLLVEQQTSFWHFQARAGKVKGCWELVPAQPAVSPQSQSSSAVLMWLIP